LSTPKKNSAKRGKSTTDGTNDGYNLPTPNILKFSKRDITPLIDNFDNKRRFNSESRESSKAEYPVNALRIVFPTQTTHKSPFKKFEGSKIFKEEIRTRLPRNIENDPGYNRKLKNRSSFTFQRESPAFNSFDLLRVL
jgi:hypothetical protein